MESVRGLEFVTFEQRNADDEPWHAAMLPFTRNVFDPMDYTPLVLDRIPHIERRTTGAFQLALTVLFTSGIQHYAEIPAGMAKAPDYVRDFLRELPSMWDEVGSSRATRATTSCWRAGPPAAGTWQASMAAASRSAWNSISRLSVRKAEP